MNKLTGKPAIVSVITALTLTTILAGCSTPQNNDKNSTTTGPVAKPKITSSVFERNAVPQEEGTVDNNRWTKWINEKAPAEVTFVPVARDASKQKDKYNVLFASGSAPDLIFEYTAQNLLDWYNTKQLMPLDDLIEKHSTTYKQWLQKYPDMKKLATASDGKMYMFKTVQNGGINDTILIRKDWLDKLKLEVPKTVDDWLKVAIAFADQDPDGNGKKDTYGINIQGSDAADQINKMFNDWNSQFGYTVYNGQLVKRLETTKAAADFKKKLFDAGAVDKDFLVNKPDKVKQDWISGRLGIYTLNGNLNNTASLAAFQALKKNVPTAEVIALAYPETPFGKLNPIIAAPFNAGGAAINILAKDPVAVMKYVDFLVGAEASSVLQDGFENVHYKPDANGCAIPIDQEKNTKERGQTTSDLSMLSFGPGVPNSKCSFAETFLNPADPIQKSFKDLVLQARKDYIDPNREFVQPLLSYPVVSDDLSLIRVSLQKDLATIWDKAIIGGKAYTIDQAFEDAKAVWAKNGGPKLDEYMAKWYQENKDTVVTTKNAVKMWDQK
ncbi:putative aldouronate transport system substrate-binding protein [Paenibacillus sp. 1_12]|uniref:hypothetical protein n=1 Tax=Paenibacillus sp. 1_12 TaxID=1566278 RepID=UPI0008F2953D|nr:hypothetical protein [Paenibacillus sp. 1_12]SFL00224.1 putative aldouronate transport system substrate-binding protein [Paenibacillus sp. 1_12]